MELTELYKLTIELAGEDVGLCTGTCRSHSVRVYLGDFPAEDLWTVYLDGIEVDRPESLPPQWSESVSLALGIDRNEPLYRTRDQQAWQLHIKQHKLDKQVVRFEDIGQGYFCGTPRHKYTNSVIMVVQREFPNETLWMIYVNNTLVDTRDSLPLLWAESIAAAGNTV